MSCSDKFPDRTINILKVPGTSFTMADLPPVLAPEGLSRDRAVYLFKGIRQFCHEESRNMTCPEPHLSLNVHQSLRRRFHPDIPFTKLTLLHCIWLCFLFYNFLLFTLFLEQVLYVQTPTVACCFNLELSNSAS